VTWHDGDTLAIVVLVAHPDQACYIGCSPLSALANGCGVLKPRAHELLHCSLGMFRNHIEARQPAQVGVVVVVVAAAVAECSCQTGWPFEASLQQQAVLEPLVAQKSPVAGSVAPIGLAAGGHSSCNNRRHRGEPFEVEQRPDDRLHGWRLGEAQSWADREKEQTLMIDSDPVFLVGWGRIWHQAKGLQLPARMWGQVESM